jgi:hypothetical protein
MCIFFNSWAVTFTYEFIEYDFKYLITTFVTEISYESILTLKIFITVFLIIIFEVLSFIVRQLFQKITYDSL